MSNLKDGVIALADKMPDGYTGPTANEFYRAKAVVTKLSEDEKADIVAYATAVAMKIEYTSDSPFAGGEIEDILSGILDTVAMVKRFRPQLVESGEGIKGPAARK
jgi:hypothetical protein